VTQDSSANVSQTPSLVGLLSVSSPSSVIQPPMPGSLVSHAVAVDVLELVPGDEAGSASRLRRCAVVLSSVGVGVTVIVGVVIVGVLASVS
jgi:hypothetical protein